MDAVLPTLLVAFNMLFIAAAALTGDYVVVVVEGG